MNDFGYRIKHDKVKFVYFGSAKTEVRIFGNFMGWSENDPEWKMHYNPESGNWELEVLISKIKGGITGDFYEFTFIVDGDWIDADKNAPNLNFCPGYGYRYLLNI
jgi:1,4-alpha-glucan branching enzyme